MAVDAHHNFANPNGFRHPLRVCYNEAVSNDPRINLLEDHFALNKDPDPGPWRMGRYFFGAVFGVILLAIGFSYVAAHVDLSRGDNPDNRGFFQSIASFVTSGDRPLEGEEENRVNVLVLGHGGAGHDGPELTDTIIFASFEPKTQDVGIMSIPRDLTIPIDGYDWRKINHANYFGELARPGQGGAFAANAIGNVLGQTIHYYVKIDFDGFEQFIDALGGIDVYVERDFVDTMYPTDDYLTRTIRFKKGWQHMDGVMALMFARSRHGSNGEGSDFARSKRQQLIMLAVRNRLFAPTTVLNPARISELIQTVRGNIETNVSTWELLRLARQASDIAPESIRHVVLDTAPESPLYETTINGAYVIMPKNDDWGELRRLADSLVGETASSLAADTFQRPTEHVRIAIQNGTETNGLAFRTSQLLEGQGYEVVSIANADTRSFDHSIIYDFSSGAFPEELKALQDYIRADIATTLSGWLFTGNVTPRSISLDDEGLRDGSAESNVDFLIILGNNSSHLVRQ